MLVVEKSTAIAVLCAAFMIVAGGIYFLSEASTQDNIKIIVDEGHGSPNGGADLFISIHINSFLK